MELECQDACFDAYELADSLREHLQESGEWEARLYEVDMSQRPVLDLRPRVLAIREVRGGALPSQGFPKPRRPIGYRRDTLDEWNDALNEVPSASGDTEDSDREPDEVEYAPNSERNEEDEYLGEDTPLAPSSASRSDSL